MSRNERQTCEKLIEPKLVEAGWELERELSIGPGRVNLTGDTMYDAGQKIIADYLLRYRGIPMAIVEAKSEDSNAADAMQQGSRYAQRMMLRFSIATNGNDWILTDNETGEFETLSSPPSPNQLAERQGVIIDWEGWGSTFEAPFYIDQVNHKKTRPYQEMAINKALWQFASGEDRALLLMATGTGKTFTVFQLVWKMMTGGALKREHVLFLTDRNSLKDQAYKSFFAFNQNERVMIDKSVVAQCEHKIGKVFFANYQTLDEELDGKKVFEHYDPDFFDLVIIDECHRSGFGDWFGVLEHFSPALQLGLTATPRELEEGARPLTKEELRRDTYEYFGEPVYIYSLKQAIDDGFLVPYLLEQRITNVDEEGYTDATGKTYQTANFEREVRLPDRTRAIAEDLWRVLGKYDLRDEKSIIFCVDDTHAAFMAQELRRLSGDPEYAARITRSERNSHQLERNFATVGSNKPRIAVTVDLLTTGFDAPDVKNIVFVRPLKSAILYKQMKGRGTRLCEDVNKRYFTIFDYSGASHLEDTEFDGHPANKQKGTLPSKKPKKKSDEQTNKPVGEGVSVEISAAHQFICLADGQKIPFDEYAEKTREFIQSLTDRRMEELLELWIDKNSRAELREELGDHDIYPAAFSLFLDMPETDEVDILAKVGFDLTRVPTRLDRVIRFWEQDSGWFESELGILLPKKEDEFELPNPSVDTSSMSGKKLREYENAFRLNFWDTSLDHYILFGIDELEQARTYGAPQFTKQFGSFQTLTRRYGGAIKLKNDLEAMKHHLYVPMAA